MRIFSRGISDERILNKAKDFFSTEIGQKLINSKKDGKPVFNICIRDNYFNIYWNGCSVLKYSPNATKNTYQIHKKYIFKDANVEEKDYINLSPELKFENWDFSDAIIANAQNGEIPLVNDYVKGEKEDIKNYILRENPFLLDLEVAFTRERSIRETENSKLDFVADRIDMARIDLLPSGEPILRLVEVKRAQDSRLRSEKIPEIMDQMERYQTFIDSEIDNIKKSYRVVANNMLELGLDANMAGIGSKTAKDILQEFSQSPAVDERPHLLVIGEKQELSGNVDHWQKLKELFAERYPAPVIWS